jgi:hypothetical protein
MSKITYKEIQSFIESHRYPFDFSYAIITEADLYDFLLSHNLVEDIEEGD